VPTTIRGLIYKYPIIPNKPNQFITDVLAMTIEISFDDFFIFFFRSEEIAQCSIKLELVNDCFTELRGEIAGPPGMIVDNSRLKKY
jgi:hypothetical protein